MARARLLARALAACAACAACAAWAAPAAADPASEANTRFLWGRELYGQGRYREALDQFLASNRLAPNPAPALGIARCYGYLGWFDEAYNAYDEYLAHHVGSAEAARARAELEALWPKVARLRVDTTPPGATIWLDRTNLGAIGVSPRAWAAAPGAHQVIVELERYRLATATVTLERGREVAVHLTLVERTGRIDVTTRPPGAAIRLTDAEGPLLGTSPAHVELPIGPRQLHLALADHEPAQPTVVVAEDRPASLDVALSPRPAPSGRLRVETNVAAALVRVDDREVGFTPLVLELPERAYRVSIHKPGHESFEAEVVARADHTVAVEVTLEPTLAAPGRGPLPWLAAAATGGLGAATALFGAQALAASSAYDESRAPTREQFDRVGRLNTATDVLLLSTALSAGVTVAAFLLTAPDDQRPSIGRVEVAP